MSGLLNAIEISSRGLTVQRTKMNTVAENMANAETTETPEGVPYRRKRVIITSEPARGRFKTELRRANGSLMRTHQSHIPGRSVGRTNQTELSSVSSQESVDKNEEFRLLYDPTHPDANEDGYVRMPNVDIIEEMVDMMTASRGYEANTVAISTAKKMANDALEI